MPFSSFHLWQPSSKKKEREWSINFLFAQNLSSPNYLLPIQSQCIQLTFDCSIQSLPTHLSQRRIVIPYFLSFFTFSKNSKVCFSKVCHPLLLMRISVHFCNLWLLSLCSFIHYPFFSKLICKKKMQRIFGEYFQHLEEIYWDAEVSAVIHAHYQGTGLLRTLRTNHSDVSAGVEWHLFRFLH